MKNHECMIQYATMPGSYCNVYYVHNEYHVTGLYSYVYIRLPGSPEL